MKKPPADIAGGLLYGDEQVKVEKGEDSNCVSIMVYLTVWF